jgi:hypothetical protein
MTTRIVNGFMAFAVAEPGRYEDHDSNRVNTSLHQVLRYLQFVEIVRARRQAVSDEVVIRFRQAISKAAGEPPGSTRVLTAEEVAELGEDARLQQLLHLEIESFFLFAKILLDKIAHFIEDFFGVVRGTPLRSHDRWCKSVDEYARAKKLDMPAGIFETMHRLGSVVADYRDKQIAHLKNPRALHLTCISGDGATQIGTNVVCPKETDKFVTSPTADEVANLIEEYIGQLLQLVETNRGKGRYRLRESQ